MTSRYMVLASAATALLLSAGSTWADTHYVDADNGAPSVPYTTPATAATTIAAALGEATAGDTVDIDAAGTSTYAEAITLGAAHDMLTIIGTGGQPTVTGGVTLGTSLSGLTLENIYVKHTSATPGSFLVVTSDTSDLTLKDCVFDGELIDGLRGIGSGPMVDDLTVTGNEFKDIREWPVLDTRSGSGGDGTILGTIILTDNFIHDCNGTISFRGYAGVDPVGTPSKIVSVTVARNVWNNIGGNAEQGFQWAAVEINRTEDAEVYCNSINDVELGIYGEGEIMQAWSVTTLTVYDNRFSNCDQGIWLAKVDASPFGDMTATLYNNSFDSNGWGIKSNPGNPLVDAEDNWWGSTAGPKDTIGTDEADASTCFPVADMVNADGNPDSLIFMDPAGTDNVDYCPWVTSEGSLTIESLTLCQGDTGDVLYVDVWMRDVLPFATGFYAEINFDDSKLSFNAGLSSYTSTPFPSHLTLMASALTGAGELQIDGNTFDTPTNADPAKGDHMLATLCFDITDGDCTTTSVDFDTTPDFISELSYLGVGLVTTLVDSGDITLDDTPPVITCPADITQAADVGSVGGCTDAVVTFTVTAEDDCDGTLVQGVDIICVPSSGSVFPVGITTVTCTATDACGNESECMFDVEVTLTNVVCLTVHLVGSSTATMRCIHLQTDDCSAFADVDLAFDSSGMFTGEIEIPCGLYTSLCAKDEQHTHWDTSALTDDGVKYTASTTLTLDPGDNDNDADVDINDVTWLIGTFGFAAADGDCPYDGTRDADYSNNGAVGSEDYSLLSGNWLTTSTCVCTSTQKGPRVTRVRAADLEPWLADRVDLLRDGVIDWRDVAIFERDNGLPDTLSKAIKGQSRR